MVHFLWESSTPLLRWDRGSQRQPAFNVSSSVLHCLETHAVNVAAARAALTSPKF